MISSLGGRRITPLALFVAASACGGEDDTLAGFEPDAPIVIETTPRDGEVDVDADLEQITATFSEAMDLDGWSWVTEVGRSTPSITGLPFYLDEHTTVLPVRLEPGTTYGVWVNSPDDAELRKFMSSAGISARAYRIRFTTRASR
ncbi:MAG TPA: Ig-like domain-containing protein [Polyangiaceae bacterium]|nr:Ig-like domain-containing protein [Polyangiaceae bacterium]